MDNLAHALVGAALGRAVADRRVRYAALIGAAGANVPDVLELFTGVPGSGVKYLVLHRGITHSLAGVSVEIAALTLITGVVWRLLRSESAPRWSWLGACIGVAILSHVFMDWLGSYGWRPLLPWSGRWIYLDWVAIVDPFFWLVPLIALAWGSHRHWLPLAGALAVGAATSLLLVRAHDLVAPWVFVAYGAGGVLALVGWARYWFGPVARRRAAALALAGLAMYTGAQALVAQTRKAAVRAAARQRFGARATWAAMPNVGHPFTWEAIYASADTVAGDDWRVARHLRAPAVLRALDAPDGRVIAQFARFLTAEVDTADRTVYLRDARYARAGRDGWAVVRIRME